MGETRKLLKSQNPLEDIYSMHYEDGILILNNEHKYNIHFSKFIDIINILRERNEISLEQFDVFYKLVHK